MNRPLVSYVLTAYNIESFIEASIDAAFAQTYSPLQIVLSDDASTDRTFAIMTEKAAKYHGPHTIKLNQNETNLGITEHMNKAYLALAEGEIIIAAHGDDISKKERTQKSVDFLCANPEYTAVSFSIEVVDESLIPHAMQTNQVQEQKNIDLHSGGNIPAPSRAFWKHVMQTFGPLHPKCPTEDELISFRALLLGKNALLPEVMVQYRKHAMSSSNPENFSRFPLDQIVDQQVRDMDKAIALGRLSEEEKVRIHQKLETNRQIRTRYRHYFSTRNMQTLWKLISYSEVNARRKIHYLKEHSIYLRQKWTKKV